jgi:hypothetical protein
MKEGRKAHGTYKQGFKGPRVDCFVCKMFTRTLEPWNPRTLIYVVSIRMAGIGYQRHLYPVMIFFGSCLSQFKVSHQVIAKPLYVIQFKSGDIKI